MKVTRTRQSFDKSQLSNGNAGFLIKCGLLPQLPAGTSSLSLESSPAHDELLQLLPPLLESEAWSTDDFYNASILEALEQNHPWSPLDFSTENSIPSIAPLSTLRPPNPETSHKHRTSISSSDRSSCISHASSTRSWHSASTSVSVPDLYAEDQPIIQLLSSQSPPANRLKRSTFGANDIFEYQSQKITPKESCPCPETNHGHQVPSNTQSKANSPDHHTSKGGSVTPKTGKSQANKYICTVCNFAFSRKGDWERHEDSKHDPQTYWTCMLGDPAVQTIHGWSCVFCNTTKSTRDEIMEHLKQHKINICTNKPQANRTWTRKDKLKQHLQQVHSLSEGSSHWDNWHRPASRKGAWGCGFCGACSFTWEGRLIHIAEHYENKSSPTPQWSQSLMIRGLLKQCHKHFNIAGAWKALLGCKDPNGDRLLEWSKADATMLKRKLEFHEGTPRELATEAYRLAINPSAAAANPLGISIEPRPVTRKKSAAWNAPLTDTIHRKHPSIDSSYF